MNSIAHTISKLLPYKLEGVRSWEIPKALAEFHLLLKMMFATLDALKMSNISAFDPLIGDNFCQSRALDAVEKLQTMSNLGSWYLPVVNYSLKFNY